MPAVVPQGVSRLAKRAGWNVIDQILSALSNVVLSVLVARTVDASGFGAFSTAFLVFSLLLALVRALIASPLQITFAATHGADFGKAVRSALGATLLVGIATGGVAVLIGFALANQSGHALIAVGVCLPALLVQDTCRMAFVSEGHPGKAAAIDGIWAVVEFALLAGALGAGLTDVRVPIVIWGASAGVAAIVGMRMLGAVPHMRGAIAWTLGQRRLTGYLLAEYVLGQGLAQVGILAVAIVGTPSGVGALRAAQVLLGPLGILSTAAFMFAVPEIARRPEMTHRNRQTFVWGLSAVMVVVTAIYCGIMLLIPESLGKQLFGATWTGAESVLLPMCLLSVGAAMAVGPAAVLYGMGHAKVTFSINMLKAPLLCVSMFFGIKFSGAVGAAWALAATEAVLLPVWFVRTGRILTAARVDPMFPIILGDPAVAGAAESAIGRPESADDADRSEDDRAKDDRAKDDGDDGDPRS